MSYGHTEHPPIFHYASISTFVHAYTQITLYTHTHSIYLVSSKSNAYKLMPTADFSLTRLTICGIFKIKHNKMVITLKTSAINSRTPMLEIKFKLP